MLIYTERHCFSSSKGGKGVGDFVLEDFDDFLFFVGQLGRHYISICVYTYGLMFGSNVVLC